MSDPTPRLSSRHVAASDRRSADGSESAGDAYRITVKGTLDQAWSTWFEGMTVTHEPDGDTALVGIVRDQAALHGLLGKIRDLGLTLIAVEPRPRRPAR